MDSATFNKIFLCIIIIIVCLTMLRYMGNKNRCKEVEIWQLSSEKPGTWQKAFAAAYIPAENSYFLAFFDQGQDFIPLLKSRYTRQQIDKMINILKQEGYQKLNTQKYAKNYGVQNYV